MLFHTSVLFPKHKKNITNQKVNLYDYYMIIKPYTSYMTKPDMQNFLINNTNCIWLD